VVSIVFDLDGTLVDSAELLRDVGNKVLVELDLPLMVTDEARLYIGNGAQAFLEKMLRARDYNVQDALADELDRFLMYYSAAPGHANKPFPWVADTLKDLTDQGHHLALCTNKPTAPTQVLLKDLGWVEYFQAVICGDTLQQRKPDPAPLLEAIRRLPMSQSFYVGDSEVDASTAQSAGIPFIFFTEGYAAHPIEQWPIAATFRDFRDLPSLLMKLAHASDHQTIE
jgi:phosphoglycolate phosphatase